MSTLTLVELVILGLTSILALVLGFLRKYRSFLLMLVIWAAVMLLFGITQIEGDIPIRINLAFNFPYYVLPLLVAVLAMIITAIVSRARVPEAVGVVLVMVTLVVAILVILFPVTLGL